METKTLSQPALLTIDRYLHFKVCEAVCSVPYFNNKTARNKVALRAYKGKGSPEDIHDEVEALLKKSHIDFDSISSDGLKKALVDHNLGIECSGFTYHVLDAECQSRGLGHLRKHLAFVNCKGIFGKAVCSLRPAENCDVATFADDANSRIVPLDDVSPGDFITMTGGSDVERPGERNHIVIIHEVGRSTASSSVLISYTHSAAYPEDGAYGTGVKQGHIEVSDVKKPLTEAKWIDGDDSISSGEKASVTNRLFTRSQKSKTELRRLKWW